MNDFTYKLFAGVGAFALMILLSMLLAYPYMYLWNTFLVPAVPALKSVEWMQMWGITILLQGLIKSSK